MSRETDTEAQADTSIVHSADAVLCVAGCPTRALIASGNDRKKLVLLLVDAPTHARQVADESIWVSYLGSMAKDCSIILWALAGPNT